MNSTLALLGLPTINFLGSEGTFIPMILMTDIWKSAGWGAIVYLAAISGIDQDQYESAQIDGATRMQQMFRITLPNIMPTVTIMFILSVGGLMSSGFDQIFNLANAATKNVSEVLDVYIYRITFQSSTDFSFSTAVSLFRSLVNMILLLLADRVAKNGRRRFIPLRKEWKRNEHDSFTTESAENAQNKKRMTPLDYILFTVLLVLALLILIPFWNVIMISFATPKEYADNPLMMLPMNPTLENYKALFADGSILTGYWNTFKLLIVGLPLSLF